MCLLLLANRHQCGQADAELVGFTKPLIHMYNKNQSAVPEAELRPHILLLGDGPLWGARARGQVGRRRREGEIKAGGEKGWDGGEGRHGRTETK